MLTRTRRRRVVEEVTEVICIDTNFEAYFKRQERERMKYEQNRLDSFDSSWLVYYQLDVSIAQRLAKAGFYCWGVGNTECFSCGLCKDLSFWQQHDPETVHYEESPNCKFITGQSENVPIALSVLRRFQIFISNTFKQNKEIEQPDNNQTKLRSEKQQSEYQTKTNHRKGKFR